MIESTRPRGAPLPVAIEPMTAADWPGVARIYQEGIDTGRATFETSVPDWATFDSARLPIGRLVARGPDGRVMGWVVLSPVSRRACYAGVAEITFYVAAEARGRGVGRALVEAAIAASEAAGIWTLQAGTFAENEASLRLQLRCGFRIVGRRERIATLHGKWHDTILMERRSPVVHPPVGAGAGEMTR